MERKNYNQGQTSNEGLIILINLLNPLLSHGASLEELFAFGGNKYCGRDEDEGEDVREGKRLRHKDLLQRMPVDDKHLSDQ